MSGETPRLILDDPPSKTAWTTFSARLEVWISERIPELERRVRARLLPTLIGHCPVVELDVETDGAVNLEAATVESLLTGLVRLERDESDVSASFELLLRAHAVAPHERARERLLEDWIDTNVEDPRQRLGDRRAVGRHFDIDAMRERNAVTLHRLGAAHELGLRALASAIPRLAELDRDGERGADTVVDLVVDRGLDAWLAERIVRPWRWHRRLAAAEGLREVFRVLAAEELASVAAPSTLRLAIDILRAGDDHPWIQAGAGEIVLLADPPSGLTLIGARALEPMDAVRRDDFVTRRLLAGVLIHQCERHESARRLIETLIRDDASEHVRLGIADDVRHARPERALEFLTRLSGTGDRDEPSERVRARAALSILTLASSATDAGPAAARLLVQVLGHDESELVFKAISGFIVDDATWLRGLDVDLQRDIERALEAAVKATDLVPAIQELAAGALEALRTAVSEPRARWTEALLDATKNLPLGGTTRVSLADLRARLPAPPANTALRVWIGRILATLSRDDYGLSADLRTKHLILHRGERRRRRAWRVLHELRNRAPNKRQAFLHTTARTRAGSLRAPPGRLDEITATVVPGERLFVEPEGGWGRHLPRVEDVMDVATVRRRSIDVFSSFGATTIHPPRGLLRRLWARLRLSVGYARYARIRTGALREREAERRLAFSTALAELGITLDHDAWDGSTRQTVESPQVAALFRAPAVLAAPGLTELSDLSDLSNQGAWLDELVPYLLSLQQNGQIALATFLSLGMVWFLFTGWRKRARIADARARIPLSIGGWGTRGKSGTERIKAAFFQGLGYDVFSKTTGCEAMMLHAIAGEPAREIFIYRAYDKATIWEQRDMLELAADLGTEVFLWECMALNPVYVEQLEHEWMRDDITTLTNAFPDHEDIQGPSGGDVADVIARFMPPGGRCIGSEVSFKALLEQQARDRATHLTMLGDLEHELIADDFLELFPYSEHPRNIALVRRLGEDLGVDPDLCTHTMAAHVVPDLGVLKVFPPVRYQSRRLVFISGQSANERTGFMNNWRRTGCDSLSLDDEPFDWVITVVNNRADRISRSEVFARILVHDAAADRHVLIGTNLEGLRGYIAAALDEWTSQIVLAEEGTSIEASRSRLADVLDRLRLPPARSDAILLRIRRIAGELEWHPSPEDDAAIVDAIETVFTETTAVEPTLAVALSKARATLGPVLESRWDQASNPVSGGVAGGHTVEPLDDLPEVDRPAERDHAIEHATGVLARAAVRAAFERRLESADGVAASNSLSATLRAATREVFMAGVVTVEDSGATGDQVIHTAAQTVPPGFRSRVMGCQNIKGTGLDFAYRWLAVGAVANGLEGLGSSNAGVRADARAALEGFGDHGLLDSGLLRAALDRLIPSVPDDEREALERLRDRAAATFDARRAKLGATERAGLKKRVFELLETWIDPFDSIARYRASERLKRDLIARRISHPRASVEMRDVYKRQKGGWLAKRLSRKK